ncbi:hypothetical protein [Larkinella arboricola]
MGFLIVYLWMYAWGQPGSAQVATLPATHFKYRITQQLCRQLAIAFGELRMPRLTMIAVTGSQRIARFVSKPEPELLLDEKLYDLCRGFGPDSLAALSIVVGHELTHYYGRHTEWAGFGQLPGQQKSPAAQAEQTRMLEAQADLQGVYRSFLAGYDVYRLVKPLYTKIYAAYQLPVTMAGYPSREERIRSIEQQAAKARNLGMAFEAGLFFFLKRDYALAERCFEFVTEEIPTKELLNNVGLCQLLRATEIMTLVEMPFRYPFEVEISNRLTPNEHRGNAVDKADLLKQAISYFRQAIDLDETYSSAYINLAAASSLLGRNGTASEIIDQLEEVLKKQHETLSPNAHLVRAIALAEQGKDAEAMDELKPISDAYEMEYNRQAIQNYSRWSALPSEQAFQEWKQLASRHRAVDNGSFSQRENRIGSSILPFPGETAFADRLAIPEPHWIRIQSNRTNGEVTYRLMRPDTTYEMVRSLPGTAVQTRAEIQSGDSLDKLLLLYGPPSRVVPAGMGDRFYCYDAAHLFVAIRQNRVHYWIIYTVR